MSFCGRILTRFQSIPNRVLYSIMAQPDTFLYFAFGSNLWSKRMQENGRYAKVLSVAKLSGHKLEFAYWATRWHGAAANIVPDPESHVYGVLWELKLSDMESLDKQEGLFNKVYQRHEMTVETYPEGKTLKCWAYKLHEETREQAIKIHGENLIPSLRYKTVIIHGAREHGLPEDYIKTIEAHPDNGYDGDVDANIPRIT